MLSNFPPGNLFGNQNLYPPHLPPPPPPLLLLCIDLQNFSVPLANSALSPRTLSNKARSVVYGSLMQRKSDLPVHRNTHLASRCSNKGPGRSDVPAGQGKSTFPLHLSPGTPRGKAENKPLCSVLLSPHSLCAVWTLINCSWDLVCPACL